MRRTAVNIGVMNIIALLIAALLFAAFIEEMTAARQKRRSPTSMRENLYAHRPEQRVKENQASSAKISTADIARPYMLSPRLMGWEVPWTFSPSVIVVLSVITARQIMSRPYSKMICPLVFTQSALIFLFVIFYSGLENGDDSQYHNCLYKD